MTVRIVAEPVGTARRSAECRAMSKFVVSLSGSQLGRSLKNGTRDFASDWRHWSWIERIAAILAALLLLLVPALVGRSI